MPSYNITLRRVLSICAVLACIVTAPLAQGPRQPFSRIAVTVTPIVLTGPTNLANP